MKSSWSGVSITAAALLWAGETLAAINVDHNPVLVLDEEGDAPFDIPETYYSALHDCPVTCVDYGNPHSWIGYPSVSPLDRCQEPMLLDFSIYQPIDDPGTNVYIRACTASAKSTQDAPPVVDNIPNPKTTSHLNRRSLEDVAACAAIGTEVKSTLQIAATTGNTKADDNETATLLDRMLPYFEAKDNCNENSIFSHSNKTVVGIYIGSGLGKPTVASALKALAERLRSDGSVPGQVVAQLCEQRQRSQVFGIAVDTNGDLAAVQKKLAAWAEGTCTTPGLESKNELSGISVIEINPIGSTNKLQARGSCETITVGAGEFCDALAKRCKLSNDDFYKYNTKSDLCSTLQEGDLICCTDGGLPVIDPPKKNSDGSCAVYYTQSGDTCSKIGKKLGVKADDIEKWNSGTTWGWTDCPGLQARSNICVSEGSPPLPAPQSGTECGPLVPGTKMPTDNTSIVDLNPCPLKACCDNFGFCGVSSLFCEKHPGKSKSPGSRDPAYAASCVSSCGIGIARKRSQPVPFQRVGYYESWNFNRDCLHLKVRNANTDGSYTHIHWAFATIDTSTWKPIINDSFGQWSDFKNLGTVKKIVSFGGWGYSTEPATYDILRQAMTAANRNTFAANVAQFLNDEGLDGADFDWEYPGAPDIDGIPPGLKTDGTNYLAFLMVLKSKLGSGKSVSIAAPASYWYLKAFPIDRMAQTIDYIVYMTYDLHGQWDYANKNAIEGCDFGDCLRSHVNITETENALGMITKAGVPTNKIFVGESSYGRSFHMAQAGCTGPACKYTGSRTHSDATEGKCTKTAGYISNAEIDEIISSGGNVQTFHDADSDSDILVYNGDQWVAYMTKETKESRRAGWKNFNFRGTIDWAVDLQSYNGDDMESSDDEYEWEDLPGNAPPVSSLGGGSDQCPSKTYSSLDDLEKDTSTPLLCRAKYLLETLRSNLTTALSHYDDLLKHGYDGKFDTYAQSVADSAQRTIDKFMRDHGNDYFTCEVNEIEFCCSDCKKITSNAKGGCTYCFQKGDCYKSITKRDHGDPTGGKGNPFTSAVKQYLRKPEPCPPDYSQRGLSAGNSDPHDTVWWTLPDSNKDKFYAALLTNVGINQTYIKFQDRNQFAECDAPSQSLKECQQEHWDFGYPVAQGYSKKDVDNPKTFIQQAYNNLKSIADQISQVIAQNNNGTYVGDISDAVDAVAAPIFMVSAALAQMDQVVKVADSINEAKRKAIIFAFLSALFMLIPIGGEAAAALGAISGLARIASLLTGALGNLALDVYSIVDDPKHPMGAIFGLIPEPLGLLDAAILGKAAAARRSTSYDDLGKMDKRIEDGVKQIDRIKGACRLSKKRELPGVGSYSVSGLLDSAMPDVMESV